MIRVRSMVPRAVWLGCLLAFVTLSGCSAPYQFRYHYTLIAPADGTDGIDDERVRVRVNPSPDVGVLQLTVINKSLQPVTIEWEQTRYIDPLGHSRATLDAGAGGFFKPQGWPAGGTRIVPGEAFQTTIRPAGLRTARVQSLSPYAGQPDFRVPPSEEFRAPPRASGSSTANPFTISRSTGGEVSVSTTPQPLLPTSGNTPSLGQAYKDRDFRFILALRFETRVVPYTFTFRITNVEVQQQAAQTP